MKFVLATLNPGKIREMSGILSEFNIDIVTRKDIGVDLDVKETGSTFKENALIKARAIRDLSGMPSIADDSGLIVEALGGAPGLFSSDFGGEGLTDDERCAFLLKKMENVEHRSAKFVCTVICAFPNGEILSAEGECHGYIADFSRGSGGFGYDPIFLVKNTGRTMSELSPEEKNEISHRGLALRKFAMLLREREAF